MLPCLRDFGESARFVCEVPSLHGIACSCSKEAVKGAAEIRNHQGRPQRNSTVASLTTSIESFAIEILRSKDALKEAHDQLRRPAKEILLTMISDLDRMPRTIASALPHAVPIMYHMAGCSLKMNSVRCIMKEAVSACEERGLGVRCIAFDGQFAELSVQNQDRPLSVCGLAKQIWDLSKSKKKKEQLKWLFDQVHVERSLDLNDTFYINKQENQGLIGGARTVYKHVLTPHTVIVQLMNRGTASVGREENCIMENDVEGGDYILQYLPKEIVDQLNDESLAVIHSVNAAIQSELKDRKQEDHDVDEVTINLHAYSTIITEDTDASIKDTDYEAALCAVIAMGKNSEWETIEL